MLNTEFYNKYSLDIISHHPEFEGKQLKKYKLREHDICDIVGVYGQEPFEVVFRNNSYEKVQVKLSIDGIDVLTGKLATIEPGGDMWVVQPYSSLNLKAWPETTKGGAQFVFTHADKSVAVHTQGDLKSIGIIAASVFSENNQPIWLDGFIIGDKTSPIDYRPIWVYQPTYTADNNEFRHIEVNCNSSNNDSFPAVGAGMHVEQNISNAVGLVVPTLDKIVLLKYQWWTELTQELKAHGVKTTIEGFPGDEQRLMSIGSTPRPDGWVPLPFVEPNYTRF